MHSNLIKNARCSSFSSTAQGSAWNRRIILADIRRMLFFFRRDGCDRPCHSASRYTPCCRRSSPSRSASLYSALYFSSRLPRLLPSLRETPRRIRVERVPSLFRLSATRSPTGLLPGPTADPDAPTFLVCSRGRQHACDRAGALSFQEARRRTLTPLAIRLLGVPPIL